MKENRYGTSRFRRFMKHNGVFVALAVSLFAVGSVVVAGVGQSLFHTPDASDTPPEEQVEQNVTGQPDDRTTTTTKTTTKTTTIATTTTTTATPELYVLPLTNTVQKVFSADKPLYSETMGDWRLHTGVDYAGREGQNVKSVARGTVSEITDDPLWGGVIVVDHGVGVVSRYCGVTASVRVGDKMDAGSVLGTLSGIPCESAQSTHLHLEMTVDGQPIDPVTALAIGFSEEEIGLITEENPRYELKFKSVELCETLRQKLKNV